MLALICECFRPHDASRGLPQPSDSASSQSIVVDHVKQSQASPRVRQAVGTPRVESHAAVLRDDTGQCRSLTPYLPAVEATLSGLALPKPDSAHTSSASKGVLRVELPPAPSPDAGADACVEPVPGSQEMTDRQRLKRLIDEAQALATATRAQLHAALLGIISRLNVVDAAVSEKPRADRSMPTETARDEAASRADEALASVGPRREHLHQQLIKITRILEAIDAKPRPDGATTAASPA